MIENTNFLSDRQIEDLQMMAEIINAMAVSDGFPNLDACLAKHPEHLDVYNRYATVALRALRSFQGHATQAGGDELKIKSKATTPTGMVAKLIKGGATDI